MMSSDDVQQGDEDLVSVIVPAFNSAATIAATLVSVQAQTHAPIEIVVVDDGSQDGTPALLTSLAAADPRIRVISQPNSGVAVARNTGVAASRGRWIAPVDADDLWHPRKIEMQMQAARRAPRPPGLVYAWSRRIDEQDRVLLDLGRPQHRGDVFAQLVASNFLRNASAALMRRDAVLAAGGFDPGLQIAGAHGAEDVKLYLAIAEAEPVEVAPAFLVGYRQHSGTMSSSPERMRRSIELVLSDLEARRPDLPSKLLRLARMNYDLYGATLSLSGGHRARCARYLGSALARAPLEASALLACHAVWRLSAVVTPERRRPRFADLDPEQPVTPVLSEWSTARQEAAAARAGRGFVGSPAWRG